MCLLGCTLYVHYPRRSTWSAYPPTLWQGVSPVHKWECREKVWRARMRDIVPEKDLSIWPRRRSRRSRDHVQQNTSAAAKALWKRDSGFLFNADIPLYFVFQYANLLNAATEVLEFVSVVKICFHILHIKNFSPKNTRREDGLPECIDIPWECRSSSGIVS